MSNLIICYHGCDQKVRDQIVNSDSAFKKSENGYDWLVHGMYFWENDPERALEFARFKKSHPQKDKQIITNPSVVGAIIDVGFCLYLINSSYLKLLKDGYEILLNDINNTGAKLQKNKPLKDSRDLIFRYLDCAVIERLHVYRQENKLSPFDSVRGVFWEGDDLYENAGFKEENHIQICIRNPDCIKGFFIPRIAFGETL